MSERGNRAADKLTQLFGSWAFIIGQAVFLFVWFTLNTVAWFWHWDNYPFVLANLFMSAEAAFTGPIILMSSNRSAAADREVFRKDYLEDVETNLLVEKIADKLGVDRGINQ
jgi:uncharacterized membrane protein